MIQYQYIEIDGWKWGISIDYYNCPIHEWGGKIITGVWAINIGLGKRQWRFFL